MGINNQNLIYGFGINDVDSPTQIEIRGSGKREVIWRCDYYMDWTSMIRRCYGEYELTRNPSYVGCTVTDEWKYSSSFKKWVDSQPNRDWQNCSLDKDILFIDNKVYSPETCVYVPAKLNKFILSNPKNRKSLMLGASLVTGKTRKPYQASCKNPFTDEQKYLGVFATELEAHKAWQAKKHEYACQLADLQDDPRVAKALRERYAPDKDWTKA